MYNEADRKARPSTSCGMLMADDRHAKPKLLSKLSSAQALNEVARQKADICDRRKGFFRAVKFGGQLALHRVPQAVTQMPRDQARRPISFARADCSQDRGMLVRAAAMGKLGRAIQRIIQ